MIYFRIVFAAILTLILHSGSCSPLNEINHLKEFAEEYGMQINVCNDSKITCVDSLETESGCISTPQPSDTSPFVIVVSPKTKTTKTQILGTVKSKIKNESYLKYIVEAKEINKNTGAVGSRIGKFLNYDNGSSSMCFTTYTCSSTKKQDVGISCPDAKTSKNFEWVAPKEWKGQAQFIATIIKSSQEFWVIESDVVVIS